MKFLGSIAVVLVLSAVSFAGYWLWTQNRNMDESIKQACLSQFEVPAQKTLMGDVDGLCACAASISKTASPVDKQSAARQCMDKFSKPSLMARCEEISEEMKPEGRIVDCECFYNSLINLYADMISSKGDMTMIPQETRIAVVRQSATKCMKIREVPQ